MQSVLEDWEGERRRKFRRMVAISAVSHVVLFLIFTLSPFSSRVHTLPGVVRVDLVAMAPPSAAPKAKPKPVPKPKAAPKPKPKPKAKPKPKPPVAAKKVLPKDPVTKPKPAAPPPPAPVEEELDYEDVLAQLRKNDSEAFPEAADVPPTPAARPGPAGGPGRLISAEEAAWRERARAYVLQSWVLAPGFRHEELLTVVEADLSRSGEVMRTQIVQRSGNPWFDESVERAVQKAGPLPAPPDAGSWQFRFSPRDLR